MGTTEQIIGLVPVVVTAGIVTKIIDKTNKKHISLTEHARSKRFL